MPTLSNILAFLVLSTACFIVTHPNGAAGSGDGSGDQLVSDRCAACVCRARTGCKTEDKCELPGLYSSCGYLQITRPFWQDAHYPVVKGDNKSNDKAFDRCAMNYKCSVRALRAYMKRYQKDCNGDGVIDCKDFAAIHMAGAGACNGTTGQEFAAKVASCLKTEESQDNHADHQEESHDNHADHHDPQEESHDNHADHHDSQEESHDDYEDLHDPEFENESGRW